MSFMQSKHQRKFILTEDMAPLMLAPTVLSNIQIEELESKLVMLPWRCRNCLQSPDSRKKLRIKKMNTSEKMHVWLYIKQQGQYFH